MGKILLSNFRGMFTDIEETHIPDNGFNRLINFQLTRDKKLKKIPGYQKWSTNLFDTPINEIEQLIRTEDRNIFAFDDKNIYRIEYDKTINTLKTDYPAEQVKPYDSMNKFHKVRAKAYNNRIWCVDKNSYPFFIYNLSDEAGVDLNVWAQIIVTGADQIQIADANDATLIYKTITLDASENDGTDLTIEYNDDSNIYIFSDTWGYKFNYSNAKFEIVLKKELVSVAKIDIEFRSNSFAILYNGGGTEFTYAFIEVDNNYFWHEGDFTDTEISLYDFYDVRMDVVAVRYGSADIRFSTSMQVDTILKTKMIAALKDVYDNDSTISEITTSVFNDLNLSQYSGWISTSLVTIVRNRTKFYLKINTLDKILCVYKKDNKLYIGEKLAINYEYWRAIEHNYFRTGVGWVVHYNSDDGGILTGTKTLTAINVFDLDDDLADVTGSETIYDLMSDIINEDADVVLDYQRDQTYTPTFTAAVTNICTANAHQFSNGDKVQLTTTGTLPAGLALSTDYYIISRATNTFKLSATKGGTEIDITTTGAGTHTATLQNITAAVSNVTLIDEDETLLSTVANPYVSVIKYTSDRHRQYLFPIQSSYVYAGTGLTYRHNWQNLLQFKAIQSDQELFTPYITEYNQEDWDVRMMGTPGRPYVVESGAGSITGNYKFFISYVTALNTQSESYKSESYQLDSLSSNQVQIYWGAIPADYYGHNWIGLRVYAQKIGTDDLPLLVKEVVKDDADWSNGYVTLSAVTAISSILNIVPYFPKCKYNGFHLTRYVMTGNPEAPNAYYFSAADDPSNNPLTNVGILEPGDKDIITGFVSIFDRAIFFKTNYIYAVVSDLATPDGKLTITKKYGCIAPDSISIYKNTIAFVSYAGVCLLKGNEVIEVSRGKINKWLLEEHTINELKESTGYFDVDNKEYRLNVGRHTFVFNLNNDFYFEEKLPGTHLFTFAKVVLDDDNNKEFLFGTTQPYIFKDRSTRHFDGRKRWCFFQTKKFKLSEIEDYSLLTTFKMNGLLKDNAIVMDKERKVALNLVPSYENYYDESLDGFKGGDVQLSLYERSPWECEVADIELGYE